MHTQCYIMYVISNPHRITKYTFSTKYEKKIIIEYQYQNVIIIVQSRQMQITSVVVHGGGGV